MSNNDDFTIEPFGQPDGARVNFSHQKGGFVLFSDAGRWGALATKEDDLRARFLIGRKGSGKTVYLRRIEAHASKRQDLFAAEQDSIQITTPEIIEFCHQWRTPDQLSSAWRLVWRRAILRALTSLILFDARLKKLVSPTDRQQLESYANVPLLPKLVYPSLSIYSHLHTLLQKCDRDTISKSILNHPNWQSLEGLLKEHLKKITPICFYLDSVDEEFENAPMFWMRCHLGLFHEVMNLLRDHAFGGRLHVFVCLRDIVLTSALASEHATKYSENEYIRRLDWNLEAARFFLEQKIKSLDSKWKVMPHANGGYLKSWLGFDTIRNVTRGVDEPVEQYLLRHTRLLPRDIVVLGNAICKNIIDGNFRANGLSPDQSIRNIVSKCAGDTAREQLRICVNQISSDQTPTGAVKQGYSDIYVAKEFQEQLIDKLTALIENLKTDRFTFEAIKEQREQLAADFQGVDPFDVMWQNGMIGWIDQTEGKERTHFFSASSSRGLRLPGGKSCYVFHPCILDAFNVEAVGKTPVIPYEGF